MSDSGYDRLIHIIDEITKSYDNLRKFESEGCTKGELEKLLIHIRDVSGEIPSMVTVFYKENPASIPMLEKFIQILKPPFLQTFYYQLLLFATTPNPDAAWLKTQVAMTIAIMNGDGWVDGLKAIRTFLKK